MVLGKGPTLNCLGTLVENHLTMNVQVYFWTLSCIPLIYMSIILLVPDCLDCSSFVVSFDTGKCESFKYVLPFQYCIPGTHSFSRQEAAMSPFAFQSNKALLFYFTQNSVSGIQFGTGQRGWAFGIRSSYPLQGLLTGAHFRVSALYSLEMLMWGVRSKQGSCVRDGMWTSRGVALADLSAKVRVRWSLLGVKCNMFNP